MSHTEQFLEHWQTDAGDPRRNTPRLNVDPGPSPSAKSSIGALRCATQRLSGDYRDLVRVSIATAARSLWLVMRKSVIAASTLSNQLVAA